MVDRDVDDALARSFLADLPAITRQADVLVAAAGRAGLIGPGHVSPGTTVIDVGTNPTADGGLAGDVDPAVAGVAAALTPVPGGHHGAAAQPRGSGRHRVTSTAV